MKEFLTAATAGSGGSTLTGAATGQITIAVISLCLMAAFGLWGAYLRWKDSRALHEALEKNDIKKAYEIRSK